MQPNSHRTSQLSKTIKPPIRDLIYVQNNMCTSKEKQHLNYNLWSLFDKILHSCYFVLMDMKMNSTEFIRVNSTIIISKTGLQPHNLIAFDCQCVFLTQLSCTYCLCLKVIFLIYFGGQKMPHLLIQSFYSNTLTGPERVLHLSFWALYHDCH